MAGGMTNKPRRIDLIILIDYTVNVRNIQRQKKTTRQHFMELINNIGTNNILLVKCKLELNIYQIFFFVFVNKNDETFLNITLIH